MTEAGPGSACLWHTQFRGSQPTGTERAQSRGVLSLRENRLPDPCFADVEGHHPLDPFHLIHVNTPLQLCCIQFPSGTGNYIAA